MHSFKSIAVGICLGLAAIALATAPARAALIDQGVTTLDTSTGLEWLDLTESIKLSYNTVEGLFGAGQQFDGWRHATGTEVSALFIEAGFPAGYRNPLTAPFLAIIDLFGRTDNRPGIIFKAAGLYDDEDGSALVGLADLFHGFNIVPPTEGSRVLPNRLPGAFNFAFVANWLTRPTVVTTAVPEPTGISLFGVGVLLLTAFRRRKTRV